MSYLKRRIIELASKLPLDEYGKAHMRVLYSLESKEDLKTQATYLCSSAYPTTPAEWEAFEQLLLLSGVAVSQDTLEWMKCDAISNAFDARIGSLP